MREARAVDPFVQERHLGVAVHEMHLREEPAHQEHCHFSAGDHGHQGGDRRDQDHDHSQEEPDVRGCQVPSTNAEG